MKQKILINSIKDVENAIRIKLLAEIDRENVWIHWHKTIAELITAKWIGKTLNKRLANQLKERLPEGAIVHWEMGGFGQFTNAHIYVWGFAGLEYNNRIGFYFGSPVDYQLDRFEKDDACHGSAAIERNAARKRLLDNPELFAQVVNAVLKERRARDEAQRYSEALDQLCEYGSDAHDLKYFAQELAGREDK